MATNPLLIMLAVDSVRKSQGEPPVFFGGGPTLGDLADMTGRDWLVVVLSILSIFGIAFVAWDIIHSL